MIVRYERSSKSTNCFISSSLFWFGSYISRYFFMIPMMENKTDQWISWMETSLFTPHYPILPSINLIRNTQNHLQWYWCWKTKRINVLGADGDSIPKESGMLVGNFQKYAGLQPPLWSQAPWVRLPDGASHVAWVSCSFSPLLRVFFSPCAPVFPPSSKNGQISI